MTANQLIILGGGFSVYEGIKKDLFQRIKNKFVIGTNHSHHFCQDTFLSYVDDTFYLKELKYLEKLPLTVGRLHSNTPKRQTNIQLITATKYVRDCHHGVYSANLTGLFILSLAIYLLDEGEIFILGFDNSGKKGNGKCNLEYDSQGRAITHWHQHGDIVSRYTGEPLMLKHRGIGKINWYQATQLDQKTNKRISRAEYEYRVYKNESKVKIYNVSPDSKIPTFEKITYDQFFEKLDDKVYDQEKLRKEIREKLIFIPKQYKR